MELLKTKQHSFDYQSERSKFGLCRKSGYSDNFLNIQRTIDADLLELNDKGFLNDTPFFGNVSILQHTDGGAFVQNIALSNESSANEATVKDSDINHQYSKSIAFEKDFRDYV